MSTCAADNALLRRKGLEGTILQNEPIEGKNYGQLHSDEWSGFFQQRHHSLFIIVFRNLCCMFKSRQDLEAANISRRSHQ